MGSLKKTLTKGGGGFIKPKQARPAVGGVMGALKARKKWGR